MLVLERAAERAAVAVVACVAHAVGVPIGLEAIGGRGADVVRVGDAVSVSVRVGRHAAAVGGGHRSPVGHGDNLALAHVPAAAVRVDGAGVPGLGRASEDPAHGEAQQGAGCPHDVIGRS